MKFKALCLLLLFALSLSSCRSDDNSSESSSFEVEQKVTDELA